MVLMQERGAAGRGHQERTEADETAGGCLERHDASPGITGTQIDHATAARRERLRHGADVLLGDVDHATLERLVAACRRSRG